MGRALMMDDRQWDVCPTEVMRAGALNTKQAGKQYTNR